MYDLELFQITGEAVRRALDMGALFRGNCKKRIGHRFTQMNADGFKYKEIKDIILRSFKEKISVMISVDRWLSSYYPITTGYVVASFFER